MNLFSHVIFYVKDIEKTIKFYEKAFNLKLKFKDETGSYAELEAGGISLAFALESLAQENLPGGALSLDPSQPPHPCEIVFTSDDVYASYKQAVEAGAKEVSPPKPKPWNQIVGYVRDPEGILIELASKMIQSP